MWLKYPGTRRICVALALGPSDVAPYLPEGARMGENLTEFEKMLSEASEETQNAQPKKRHGLRNTLIVLVSILALVGVGAGVVDELVNSAYSEIERVETVDPNLARPAGRRAASRQEGTDQRAAARLGLP